MSYKTGEAPQKNDEVLGEVEGKRARGRVLAVRENGNVLITRRAPYEGNTKPLASVHEEVPAADLSLIYRPMGQATEPAVGTKVAAKAAAKSTSRAAAGASKK